MDSVLQPKDKTIRRSSPFIRSAIMPLFPTQRTLSESLRIGMQRTWQFGDTHGPIIAVALGQKSLELMLGDGFVISVFVIEDAFSMSCGYDLVFRSSIVETSRVAKSIVVSQTVDSLCSIGLLGYTPFAVANYMNSIIISFRDRPGLLCATKSVGDRAYYLWLSDAE